MSICFHATATTEIYILSLHDALPILPLTWPHGTETESFPFKMLERCQQRAETKFEREHVTVLMRYEEDVRRVNLLSDNPSWINLRWTLDYAEDYTFFEKLLDRKSVV